jgi:ribosomal protein S18 acetylase RimI-like enzyme
MAEVDVRVVGVEDWQLWRSLRRAALAEAPEAFGSTLAQWSGPGDTEPRWRARLGDVALNIVAVRDGYPVAMASALSPDQTAAVEIISVWVAPYARGSGAADALLARIEQWRQATHPGASTVLAVKAANSAAIGLYRRNGFRPAGTSPDDSTELIMRR